MTTVQLNSTRKFDSGFYELVFYSPAKTQFEYDAGDQVEISVNGQTVTHTPVTPTVGETITFLVNSDSPLSELHVGESITLEKVVDTERIEYDDKLTIAFTPENASNAIAHAREAVENDVTVEVYQVVETLDNAVYDGNLRELERQNEEFTYSRVPSIEEVKESAVMID